MYDYFAPNEKGTDASLAAQLLFQPWRWHKGKEINNLKRRLRSRFFSSDTSLSFYFSGRGALHQYLKAQNLQPGEHVLLPPTCTFQTVLAIKDLKLEVTFVDSNKGLGMSIEDLKRKYHDRCRVLIIHHPMGITPSDRKKLLSFAKEKKLEVVEDVRSGFDLSLFKNCRFTSAVLWAFRPHGMISSVYGAVIAVRGKKLAASLKDSEKQIPHPSFVTIMKMIIFKIGSIGIKTTRHIGIGAFIYIICNNLSFFPPKSTKKEHQLTFDPFFIKIFPNICSFFLSRQLDTFNDVLRVRSRAINRFNKGFENILDIPESAMTMYLFSFPTFSTQQHLIIKRLGISKPQDITSIRYKFQADGIYNKKLCPMYESIADNLYILPTSMTKIEQNKVIELLTGIENK